MNITPMHLGALHPVEQALTLLLAFGPFVVLGIVIFVRRRMDREPEEPIQDSDSQHEDSQRER